MRRLNQDFCHHKHPWSKICLLEKQNWNITRLTLVKKTIFYHFYAHPKYATRQAHYVDNLCCEDGAWSNAETSFVYALKNNVFNQINSLHQFFKVWQLWVNWRFSNKLHWVNLQHKHSFLSWLFKRIKSLQLPELEPIHLFPFESTAIILTY